jgi:hypothetical protein
MITERNEVAFKTDIKMFGFEVWEVYVNGWFMGIALK